MPARQPNPLLVLISAPSGGGKTTVCLRLLSEDPKLTRVITCTTRPPRPGEVDGVDYYFLSPEHFETRVAAGEFLEHAQVYGQRYGTLQSEVLGKLHAGRDVLLNIDVQGAASIRTAARLDPVLSRALVNVFITPPSFAILEERLRRRGTDSPEVIQRRLATARQEIACWQDFEYLVLSGTIAEDLRRMQVIIEAERLKQHRSPALNLD